MFSSLDEYREEKIIHLLESKREYQNLHFYISRLAIV